MTLDGATLYANECGNAFSAGQAIDSFPGVRGVDWQMKIDDARCKLNPVYPLSQNPKLTKH